MKKVIVATLVAALGASAWANFTKVQESFEDKDEIAWTYSDDGYWSSTDSAASENITTVAYGENEGYAYEDKTTEGAENVPAVDGWSGAKYLNLAKATNLSRNFAENAATVEVSNDSGYVLDTLVAFTATEAEDAPTPATSDKFLIWLEEEELESEKDGEVTYSAKTNLIIKCGNDAASSTTNLTLVTLSNSALPVKVGEWARVSVKAIPLYTDGPLGFVVYINGAAVMAGESDETYQALFAKADSLTDSAKGYYELKQIFPSLTSSTSLTAVDFKGTGKIDDFQLVAAADQPAFIVTPIVVTIKGFGTIPEDWSDAIIVEGNEISEAPETPVVKGYKFIGWYTVDENGNYIEATFPLKGVTASTTLYAKFENADVAMIGDVGYSTLQAAIDAALEMDSSTTPVQIDIISDFTTDATLALTGTSTNDTQIVLNINKDVTVTLAPPKDDPCFFNNNAKVTFKGEGKWTRPSGTKTAFCVGEALVNDKLAPGHIIIENGSFYTKEAHIFNVMNGTIEVNGGTFQTDLTTGYCVRAETSDLDDSSGTRLTGSSYVYINAGTFLKPEDATAAANTRAAPVGIKNDHKTTYGGPGTAHVAILEQKKGEDGEPVLNTDITFKGNEWAIRHIMQQYLASDYALVKDSEGVYQIAERVAEITEIVESKTVSVGYGSLQNAIDAAIAVDMSKSTIPVPITITRDLTIDQMVKIIGNGTNETKIAINNDMDVIFDISEGDEGLRIANASIVLAGNGSWTRTTSNTKQIISVGEKNDDNSECAPGNLVVNGGSFTAEASAHIISVMNGVVVVNKGTFEIKGNGYNDRFCVRAEADPDMNGHNALSYVVVNGGTFIVPEKSENGSDCVAPVGTKKKTGADYDPEVFILELDTDGNPNAALKFQGNETQICDVMGEFLGTIGKDGEPEYDGDGTYKFKLDTKDGYYKVVKTVWGTVNIDWTDGKVVSFDYYEGGEVTNIVTATYSGNGESYDIDDKLAVKVDKDKIVFTDGYELDEVHSVLTATVKEETTYTLKIVEKPTDTNTKAVDPETESEEYKTMEAANAYAATINDYKYWMIKAPSENIDKAKYVGLFSAQLSQKTTDSGWVVTVKLTEEAVKDIQEEVNEVFAKATDLDLSKIATAGASFTATVTPGLYYTVLSGTDVKAITEKSESVLAESTQVNLTLPKQDGNCGFYQIQVDVKKPTTSAQ